MFFPALFSCGAWTALSFMRVSICLADHKTALAAICDVWVCSLHLCVVWFVVGKEARESVRTFGNACSANPPPSLLKPLSSLYPCPRKAPARHCHQECISLFFFSLPPSTASSGTAAAKY